jgi:hypothetical protein
MLRIPADLSCSPGETVAEDEEALCQNSDVAILESRTSEVQRNRGQLGNPKVKQEEEQVTWSVCFLNFLELFRSFAFGLPQKPEVAHLFREISPIGRFGLHTTLEIHVILPLSPES